MTSQPTINNFTRRELARFFASLAVVSFVLHSIWEMVQMPSYKDLAGRPFLETAARCTPATLANVVLTFWIYAIGALAAGRIGWGLKSRWNVFLTLALLAATHAICIEQAALAAGRWSYNEAIRKIPRLDVGIWPLLQLTLLTSLTVWLSSRYAVTHRNMRGPSTSTAAFP